MRSTNAILIPAFNPDERLISLVNELIALGQKYIAVVDDGSNIRSRCIFRQLDALGCFVYHHAANKGKGEALKTGIRLVSEAVPDIKGYVTADSDGQHLVKDIVHISEALDESPGSLVLGVRDLKSRDVPRLRRFGNWFSTCFFRLTTDIRCPDTQTGLRAFSAKLKDFSLSVPGSRFDYEMNFLSAAAKKNIPIRLIPIETVYLNDNPSHFHPVIDSFRVYKRPLKFAAASLTCAAADLLIFTVITQTLSVRLAALTLIATVTARISSGTLNFILNRNWSFEVRHMWRPQAIRYLGLFLFIMASSWLLVWGFSFLPVALTIVKVVVDTGLFVFSYIAQRDWVFTKGRVLG